MAKSLIKLIPYFGQWPEWINFYIESCKWNPDIHWLFYTDCPEPENKADNVFYRHLSFEQYTQFAGDRLGINFNPPNPYKLCDLRPAYGFIHEEDIKNYDYYAFGDVDIIYGSIRKFLTNDLLSQYQVISTHADRISGHFMIFENSRLMRNAFRKISTWELLLQNSEYSGCDENTFTRTFLRYQKYPAIVKAASKIISPYRRRCLFQEQYSTILSPIPWSDGSTNHPQVWHWNSGRLTNTQDGDREYMYLHFMNWKSNRWLPEPLRHQPSAWQKLDQLIHTDYRKPGWQITTNGFESLVS